MNKIFDNSQLGFKRITDLVKANIDQQIEGESNYSLLEEELQKARVEHDLIVLSESGLNELKSDIQKAYDDVLIDEESLEKAHKDLGKLIKTTVIDKNGHKRTVYIARKEYKSHTEHHAEIHATIARQNALLANPKSPVSAKQRAKKILEVEHGKLEKLGQSGHKEEPKGGDQKLVDKVFKDPTKDHDNSVSSASHRAFLNSEEAHKKNTIEAHSVASTLNQNAAANKRQVGDHKIGVDSTFKPKWKSTETKNFSTLDHSGSKFTHDKDRGELMMRDSESEHTYHKPVKTEAEANEIIGRTLDGGAEDHEWEGKKESGEKGENESLSPSHEKALARLGGGLERLGEVSSSRIRDIIAHEAKQAIYGRMMGSDQHVVMPKIKAILEHLHDNKVDEAKKIMSELKPRQRDGLRSAMNGFMQGDPDFPADGKHKGNDRSGDRNYTANGREFRDQKHNPNSPDYAKKLSDKKVDAALDTLQGKKNI